MEQSPAIELLPGGLILRLNLDECAHPGVDTALESVIALTESAQMSSEASTPSATAFSYLYSLSPLGRPVTTVHSEAIGCCCLPCLSLPSWEDWSAMGSPRLDLAWTRCAASGLVVA
jgi:hypothetical protein